MTGNIRIYPEELKQEATKLESALDTFKESATQSAAGYVYDTESFNSDFSDALVVLLEHIKDDVSPSLFASIDEHLTKVREVVESFEQADSAGA